MIPRIAQGHVVSCQYWDGTAKLNENPAKSKIDGQVALWPGAGFGFLRQAHPSVDLVAARRAAHQQVQPAQGPGRLSRALARLGQEQHPDRVRPGEHLQRCLGERAHDRAGGDRRLHRPPAIKAIKTNFEVVSPPIYLTGYLEFQDALGKNLSEAYVGQLPAKDVLKKTEDEWNAIVRRIGRSKLKKDLASYKAVMPKRNRSGVTPPSRRGPVFRQPSGRIARARPAFRHGPLAWPWPPFRPHRAALQRSPRALSRAARDQTVQAGRMLVPLIALFAVRADAGAAPAALLLVPPVDGLSRASGGTPNLSGSTCSGRC